MSLVVKEDWKWTGLLEFVTVHDTSLGPVEDFCQNDFRASRHRMEIYLPVHLISAHDVILDRMHAGFLEDDLVFPRPHDAENPLHVKMAVADARVVSVALQIIHPVGVDLAGN